MASKGIAMLTWLLLPASAAMTNVGQLSSITDKLVLSTVGQVAVVC